MDHVIEFGCVVCGLESDVGTHVVEGKGIKSVYYCKAHYNEQKFNADKRYSQEKHQEDDEEAQED